MMENLRKKWLEEITRIVDNMDFDKSVSEMSIPKEIKDAALEAKKIIISDYLSKMEEEYLRHQKEMEDLRKKINDRQSKYSYI
mgnify:CR=1 FL=1